VGKENVKEAEFRVEAIINLTESVKVCHCSLELQIRCGWNNSVHRKQCIGWVLRVSYTLLRIQDLIYSFNFGALQFLRVGVWWSCRRDGEPGSRLYLRTYLLTPWGRIFFEKLTVTQLIKK
jgi:hypothetical protein